MSLTFGQVADPTCQANVAPPITQVKAQSFNALGYPTAQEPWGGLTVKAQSVAFVAEELPRYLAYCH